MNFHPNLPVVALVTLERRPNDQFLKPIWVREWQHQGRHQLGLSRSLRRMRTLPGFGIDDPYEIRLERSVLSSRTVADGLTLGEVWGTGLLSQRESFVRGMLEQLLLGLARLHDGLGQGHGYLCPENIRISPEGRASLWAFPTVSWDYSELSHPQRRHLDPSQIGTRILGDPSLYRSPEGEMSPASDVYSLCKIALDLFRGREVSEEMATILTEGTSPQILRRPTLLGLARALNPDTLLGKLDVLRGLARRQSALEFFGKGHIERAEELWQEARNYDPLSAVVWNNLAVVQMVRGQFVEALTHLQRAKDLCTSHPSISSNMAYCHWQLNNLETAESWARQANAMNPNLSHPYLCLSLLCQSRGLLESAASHAFQAVALSPQNPAARIQLARVYDQTGAAAKALVQWKKVATLSEVTAYEANLIDELREPTWGKIRVSYGNLSLDLRRV